MSLTRAAVNNRALVYAAVGLLSIGGVWTFLTMSRREDPEILIRNCVVVTKWPGAPAQKVEELVTDLIEKKILELSEVKEVESDSLSGQSIVKPELADEYTDLEQIWDKIRVKVEEAQSQLPKGCGVPYVNSEFGDVFSVVLALRQVPVAGKESVESPYTFRELEVFAETIQDSLKTLDSVAKVELYGNQREEITLDVDSGDWSKIELTYTELSQLLESRNIVEPGGSLDTKDGRFAVIPSGEFSSVDQVGDVLVGRMNDAVPVRLSDVPLQITRGYQDPAVHLARFRTSDESPERCILLSVSMREGQNVVLMGEAVQAQLDVLRRGVLPPDIEISLVNDLPRQVETLVGDFVVNLGQSILIVLAVAWLMMGWRPAIIMATAIPLSMVAAIFIVEKLGIELEQFSIASLIIALGMVVDNAIVISDNTVSWLAKGESKRDAAIKAAEEVAGPVLASTLTTVAAFLPLAFMSGGSGEYIRSLPVVVSVTLLASYAVAMCVTPLMCMGFLKRPEAPPENVGAPERTPYERAVFWCLSHKAIVLGLAGAGVVGSLQLIPYIGSQFFPAGDRDQFFVDVWLPEGSPINSTDDVVNQIQDMIVESKARDVDGKSEDCLLNSIGFVGGGPPRIGLTMDVEQTFSNYALIMVNTTHPKVSGAWVSELKEKVKSIPGAAITVRRFMLGPPVKYPVEFRLIGDDSDVLREKAELMVAELLNTPGSDRVWTNWGNSGYQVEVEIDSEAANLAGVDHKAVAQTLTALLSGGYLTTYREGDHQVRVALRLRQERRKGLDDLSGIYVNGEFGKVPLDSVAKLKVSWEPAKISRLDTRRTIKVASTVKPGYLPTGLTAAALPAMEKILEPLPSTYEIEVGGEQSESAESQGKISAAFLIGFALIILVLITQYNSFVKPFIVLAAVPLALIGALIGLFVTGWPLGFMPSLGIVALAGIVINNAIVLIDFIEGKVADGEDLRPAVAAAGQIRMKPILLTTLTTLGGMLPLALFAGPMWAGMAWAIIFGLSAATVLTLLVVPTLYVTMVEALNLPVGGVDLRARAAAAAPGPVVVAEPKPEEPKPEEPKPEEPKPEEPKPEEPKPEEPKPKEPKPET